MRLLITGGAGFIGSHLANLALANDVEAALDQGIAETVALSEASR